MPYREGWSRGDLNPDPLHAMRAFAHSLVLLGGGRAVNAAWALSDIDR
jgi:hypothetical protein